MYSDAIKYECAQCKNTIILHLSPCLTEILDKQTPHPPKKKKHISKQGEGDEENVPDECLGSTCCMIVIYFCCQ